LDIPVRSSLRTRAWRGFAASFARNILLRTGMSALRPAIIETLPA
jgi:hypothetical protein